MKTNSNIKIIYLLTFFNYSLFWYGIWVFYYLTFTNYSGIGLIESVMILAFMLFEIPSGAFADMLGRKNTLLISFLLLVLGNFTLAIATSFNYLLIAVILLSISNAFYSGTLEALAYESLDKNSTKYFDKIIANITSIEKISIALASIVGGYLFTFENILPFVCASLFAAIGFMLAFFLKESHIRTRGNSFGDFISQSKEGLNQLTKTQELKVQTILLLSIAFISVICSEVLNDVLAVEFGFEAYQLGLLLGILSLIVAISSQITPFLTKYMKSALSH